MGNDSYNKKHYARNSERLLELKDIHKGERCFIVGNGPSLTMHDLDKIVGEITFGFNKIYLAFDQTNFRPTYYSMCDEVVARNNKEKTFSLKFKKVFAHSVRKYLWKDPEAIFVNPKLSKDDQSDLIGWDLVRGANAGHSVVNQAIKIAWYMGIREMYVIGCDHNFIVPDTKTGEIIMNNDVILSQGERNHFHPDYRPKGETWTVPKLDSIAADFAESRQKVEESGGTIRNASRYTKLNVLERISFSDLF